MKLILAEPRFTSANALVAFKTEVAITAVCMAAARCNWDVLKELVHHPSVDPNVKDKNGMGMDDLAR